MPGNKKADSTPNNSPKGSATIMRRGRRAENASFTSTSNNNNNSATRRRRHSNDLDDEEDKRCNHEYNTPNMLLPPPTSPIISSGSPPPSSPLTLKKRSKKIMSRVNASASPLTIWARHASSHAAHRALGNIKTILVITLVAMLIAFNGEVERRIPVGYMVDDPNRPGLHFDKTQIHKRLPVVMVPGFITTALELWEGNLCVPFGGSSALSSSFRQRMFSAQSFLTMLTDPDCFLNHIGLDPATGGDPAGIKVRPDSSFSSTDYIIAGFWVWAKLIRNLADIGYDPNNMHIASYDWRLDAETLERRDKFFSRLRAHMEVTFNGRDRFVLIGHSYGSSILLDFLQWADVQQAGWTDTHVDSLFDIGGPKQGLPKALAALISGEVKDTAMLPSALRYLLDSHVSKPHRTRTFRSWPCSQSLLPRGGDCMWRDLLRVKQDDDNVVGEEDNNHAFATAEKVTPNASLQLTPNQVSSSHHHHRLDQTDSLRHLASRMEQTGHFFNAKKLLSRVTADETHARSSSNSIPGIVVPTIPLAPSVTMYCVYGVGLPTEVGYWMRRDKINSCATDVSNVNNSHHDDHHQHQKVKMPHGWWEVDPTATTSDDEESIMHPVHGQVNIANGVALANGDGTVPLVSLGYPCRSRSAFPARLGRVVTLEMQHAAAESLMDIRGGAATADHVDIMGNYAVMDALLHVVTGNGLKIHDRIVSNIDEVVRKVEACGADSLKRPR